MQIKEGPNDIFVFVVQDTYGEGTDCEEQEYNRFKSELETEFKRDLKEVDVAPGYSLPAFLITLTEFATPLIGALMLGANVIQNIETYLKVAKKIKSFFSRKEVLLNRNGATILAIEAVMEELGGTPKDLRLEKYYTHDPRVNEHFPNAEDHHGIAESVPTEYLEMTQHFVTILVDGQRYECSVIGKNVELRRL